MNNASMKTVIKAAAGLLCLLPSLWAFGQDRRTTEEDLDRHGFMGISLKRSRGGVFEPTQIELGAKTWGCDVSKWQGDINFNLLKTAVDFTVIRASYGSSGLDEKLAQNRSRAEAVGMAIGFYHFAYPDRGNTAEQEAQNFCNRVGSLKPGQFVVLDYEVNWNGDVVGWCKAWMDYVTARLGAKPLIYLNLSTVRRYNWSPIINADYGLWLAYWDYDKNAAAPSTPWPFVAMRQYSDRETFPGISGNVDGDVFYGTLDQLKAYGYQPVAQWTGLIEVPAANSTAALDQEVTGWAKDAGGNYFIDKASVYVGSTFVKDITYGLSRPDKGGNFGFNGGIDLRPWAGQKVNITVRLRSGTKVFDLMSSGVNVPPTPPNAPSGLQCTAKTASTATLVWTDNSSNETGFKVKRNGSVVATLAANSTSFADSGLSPNTTYTYTVCATNAGGDSSDSNSVDVTTDPLPSETITLSCRTVSAGANPVIEAVITNPGMGPVSNVVVDTVQLGAVKATGMPWTIGTLAGGASAVKNFTFSGGFGIGKATFFTVNARLGERRLRLRVKVSSKPS